MESNDNIRNSGIAQIGDLPWGSHLCQFYTTKDELLDILIPYFAAGLENNELCIWVVSDFLNREDAIRAIGKSVPSFLGRLALEHIEIIDYRDVYFKDGHFDQEHALKFWRDKYAQAFGRGFSGLRASGDICWADSVKDWQDIAIYESKINSVIGSMKFIALCTYSMDRCTSDHIVDVVHDHQCALMRNDDAWQVVANTGE